MEHGYLYALVRRLGGTELQAETVQVALVTPVRCALIVLGAVLVARFATRAISRSLRSVGRRQALRSALATQRVEQRAGTLAQVVGAVVRFVVYGITSLMVLSEVGVDLAPLIAGASVATVAIGFGTQSFVKDLVSGFCILVEDQLGVGDVVTVAGTTGTVEGFDLRVTRVRSADGAVHFIPNGEIRHVANLSMEWSIATLDVGVGYAADLAAVAALVTDEVAAFAADEAWSVLVLEEPQIRVLAAMSELRQTIRVVVRVAPRRQWDVVAALRPRLLAALRAAGVPGPGDTGARITAGLVDVGTPPPPPPLGPVTATP